MPKNTPSNGEFEAIRGIYRDFIARLDQNAADRNKDQCLGKNQTLAYDTLELLKEKKSKITDHAAEKFLDEFSSLIEKYYSQLVRFNSETTQLAQANQGITNQIQRVREDSSLSAEEKVTKHADLVIQMPRESQERTITAKSVSETEESLRKLSLDPRG